MQLEAIPVGVSFTITSVGRQMLHFPINPLLAKVLGAQEDEVAHTSTLTSNLHNLFTAFYRPTEKRWKIVIEKGSFPSDWVSQLDML